MAGRVRVLVRTGARQSEVVGRVDGVLHVRIAAPPVKGKANRELTAFLARRLGLPRSSVRVVKGTTSPYKTIEVDVLREEEIEERLAQQSGSGALGGAGLQREGLAK